MTISTDNSMPASHRAITGRVFDLVDLPTVEREFLETMHDLSLSGVSWEEFSRKWVAVGRKTLWGKGPLPMRRTVCRVCQDLAARLGIAEGRVAPPDYRECLADLIDDRFKSRYELCKKAGIDQSQLSRVLAGRGNFSSETLIKILELCGLSGTEVFRVAFSSDQACSRMENIQRSIDALKVLRTRAEHFSVDVHRQLPGESSRLSDELDGLRARIDAGEEFAAALDAELSSCYDELSRLAAEIKDEADRERAAMKVD
jgi:transcriptional regulator with XRE-family HTH domain